MFEEFKKKREELGKTIEEISEITKIKKSYLIAIEEGNYNELPLEVFTRSYIKIYAQFLGVDHEKALEDYDKFIRSKKSVNTTETVKLEIPKKPEKEKPKKRFTYPRWFATLALSASSLILALILLSPWKKEEIPPPPPPPKEEIKEKPQAVAEPVNIQEQTKRVEKTFEQELIIEATDTVWMRITIDDKDKREYLLNPGQKLSLKALKSFQVHIGNAGGVRVFFNGRDLGALGKTGQVVRLKLPQE